MGLPIVSTDIIILSIVFSVLAIIAVALRFRARAVQCAGYSLDDLMIIPGLLCAVGLCVNNVIGAALSNAGGHIHTDGNGAIIFDKTLTMFLQTEYATQLLSVLSLVCTKLSIVLFYRRIFRGQVFAVITLILLISIFAWGVAFFFATLFECMPIEQVWKSLYGTPEHEAHCYNYLPMFIATAISNMCMDVLVLTVPLPMVWRLNMATRQKVAVSIFFLLGAFVVGISVARIYFFYQSSDGFANAQDVTYNIAPTLYWTELEATIAVVCACLPTLRPLFMNFSAAEIWLKDFMSKISLFSGSKTDTFGNNSQSEQYSLPRWDKDVARGSESSARGFINTCEAVPQSDVENSSTKIQGQSGIIVQKMVHQFRR